MHAWIAPLALVGLCVAAPSATGCTAESRLHTANEIIRGYNANGTGESARIFAALPMAPECPTYASFNGAPPVLAAVDEVSTKAFATATREVFVGVTGKYTDFPDNSTTIIKGTNTFGVAHDIPLPVTFGATTVLFFNKACEIKLIHAFARVPVKLLGKIIDPPQLPPLVPFNPDPVGPPQE